MTPTYMARPPSNGTGLACILRAEGASTTAYLWAIRLTTGVASITNTSAVMNMSRNGPMSVVAVGMDCVATAYCLLLTAYYLLLTTYLHLLNTISNKQ